MPDINKPDFGPSAGGGGIQLAAKRFVPAVQALFFLSSGAMALLLLAGCNMWPSVFCLKMRISVFYRVSNRSLNGSEYLLTVVFAGIEAKS